MNVKDLLQLLQDENDININTAIKIFLDKVRIKSREPTLDYYQRSINAFLQLCPVKSVNEINENILNTFVIKSQKNNISNTTINKRIEVLRIMINYLIKRKIIENHCIKFYEKLPSDTKETQIIDNETLLKILNYIDTFNINNVKLQRDRAIILTMLDTGFRRNEIINIRQKELNAKENYIYIHYTKNGKARKGYLTEKTKKAILHYLDLTSCKSEFLFKTANNKGLTIKALNKCLDKIKRDLKINISISTHKWRHTLATNLLLNGMDIYSVKKILDHCNISITEKYLHLTDKQVQNNFNKFNVQTSIKKSETPTP